MPGGQKHPAPRISVVMAVHDGGELLPLSIESILSQTFRDFEFLIVDDCSTDGSAEIVKRYAESDPRIRVITNERNLGLSRSLIAALGEAGGEFIARQDADDISLPRRFEHQLAYMDANPRVGLAAGWFYKIDEQGRELLLATPPDDPELIVHCLRRRVNPLIHGSVLFRKSAADEAGGYDPKMRYAQDFDLWLRMSRITLIGMVQAPLYQHRNCEGSTDCRVHGNNAREAMGAASLERYLALERGAPGELGLPEDPPPAPKPAPRLSRHYYLQTCASNSLLGGRRAGLFRYAIPDLLLKPSVKTLLLAAALLMPRPIQRLIIRRRFPYSFYQ